MGLNAFENDVKKKAARIVGHICALTSDPYDLMPYMEIILPAIKNTLFDSIPEIRAAAAKSLGTLSKGLGIKNSTRLIEWLSQTMHMEDTTPKEKAGAA